MISEKMKVALNEQLNAVLYSSYIYLSMSAYFDDINLKGMAAWMKMQSTEEYAHAMKFFDFIIRVGKRVNLKQIDNPQDSWDSPIAAFEAAYAHEKSITKRINDLTDLAISEKDHATNTFLHWFVDEQVEEESTVADIVENFKLIGDSKGGLFMLDKELGKRTNQQSAPQAQ